jgi:hypothetical protein
MNTPDLEILCLVLAHRHPVIDSWVNLWRSRKAYPGIHIYFVYSDPELDKNYRVIGDEIHVRGEECIHPGVLHKTLEAMTWAVSDECKIPWTFLLRSNISSFWNWDQYLKHLQDVPHQGSVIGSLQHWNDTPTDDLFNFFLSGCGFTCSRDIIEAIVIDKKPIESGQIKSKSLYDDVILSQYLFFHLNIKKKIQIHNYVFSYCTEDADTMDISSTFHIRVYSGAGDDRSDDIIRYSKLIDRIDALES